MNILRVLPVSAVTLAAFALPASSQQFSYEVGLIPGPTRWTEGLECADVDNDGDLDIFFADGGGFSTPGTQYTNTLVINGLIPGGSLAFTNEGGARLGSVASHAKGVTTGDIDADGWIDALFANAFNTDVPHMYHNRGAGQPGFFDLESATRGFTEILSSGGANFGDLDDDGDLDVIICDSGNSYLGGAGAKPRLFTNNGSGVFTQTSPGNLNPPNKQAHMDVQYADIDADFDLDFFGINRAANGGVNHYLMVNSGAANFPIDVSSAIPATSSNAYEAEVGDLDGDTDIDLFFVSLSGFNEGPMINNFPTPTFTPGSALSGDDDNEVAMIDFDNDGDLDAYIGSLAGGFGGPAGDKMLRNNGSGVFSNATGTSIEVISDSTLDCTVADIDNDGDYDLISAQGESQNAQWVNKIYLNSGSKDTRAPVILAQDNPTPSGGSLVAHARIQDQVVDDGRNWVSACTNYVSMAQTNNATVSWDGASFSPANVTVTPGTTITWSNDSAGFEILLGNTDPYAEDFTLAAPGDTASVTFLTPGTYEFQSGLTFETMNVTVAGAVTKGATTYSGGGIYRAEIPATGSGFVCYEFVFTDYAGNTSVSPANCVSLGGPLAYCEAKPSSAGCVTTIGVSGTGQPTSGAGGYSVTASGVQGFKNGLIFAGLSGPSALPFSGGTLCVQPPNKRGPISNSGGTGLTTCDGSFSTEVNDGVIIPFGLDADSGNSGWYQYWYRDPGNGAGNLGTALSNAIQLDFQ